MSPDTGMSYQSSSWKPVEILVMVLGFIVFWPIGLGVLAWKFWQKKSGYPGDIISFGREKWGNWANWTRGSDRWGFSVKTASGFGMGSSGNRAFDEWRTTELARLEEERQKLVAAEREFAEFREPFPIHAMSLPPVSVTPALEPRCAEAAHESHRPA